MIIAYDNVCIQISLQKPFNCGPCVEITLEVKEQFKSIEKMEILPTPLDILEDHGHHVLAATFR